ncbi:MAG: YigZ family protein [Lachnospiraceae bacterium]|nr:YigZ family protein [Lachnospiraceae bacterium]
MNSFKFVFEGASAEITEKKSRFIAHVKPIQSEEDALSFIQSKKKEYWDARHNCYAYVCGSNNEISRCSDDGEPAQTAGRPMLDVILNEGVHDVCVVVTRYFGGVLLGTGGLVRAYQKATQEGLAASTILEKQAGSLLSVKCDYTLLGKVQYILGKNDITIKDTIYTDNVEFMFAVSDEMTERIISEITEGTNGSAVIEAKEKISFAKKGNEIIFFTR